MRPSIGVTMDDEERSSGGRALWLKRSYIDAVNRSGGLAIALPTTDDEEVLSGYMEKISGLVVIGGDFDVAPHHYGEKDQGQVRMLNEARTRFEKTMLERAWKRRLPILGICGGMQILNVVCGGTLVQHVDGHERCEHVIHLQEGTRLRQVMGKSEVQANSTHHQIVGKIGEDLRVCAKAHDGCVEAIEASDENYFCLGVQWHPEALVEKIPEHGRIFQQFVRAARAFGVKKP